MTDLIKKMIADIEKLSREASEEQRTGSEWLDDMFKTIHNAWSHYNGKKGIAVQTTDSQLERKIIVSHRGRRVFTLTVYPNSIAITTDNRSNSYMKEEEESLIGYATSCMAYLIAGKMS